MNYKKASRILTLLNAIAFLLFLVAGYLTLSAIGVIANYVSGFPLFIALGLGAIISVLAIYSTLKGKPKSSTFLFIVNGLGLLLYSLPLVVIGYVLVITVKQIIVIPDSYMGYVMILENIDGGESIRWENGFQYFEIPSSGILILSEALPAGFTSVEFYYKDRGGKRRKITESWYSSIHRTPENLSDSITIGIFNRTSGEILIRFDSCMVKNESLYVGTKAFLLSGDRQLKVMDYFESNKLRCKEKG